MRDLGKWSDPGVPHKGWTCVDFEDLEEPSEICQMCELAEIRYVHIMRHPEYEEDLRCGCVCAEHMEGDYVGPRRRETDAKNVSSRRMRWLTREWRISENGNLFLRTDGFVIVVYPMGDGFGGFIEDSISGRKKFSNKRYQTVRDVKAAAFDAMVQLKKRWRSGQD